MKPQGKVTRLTSEPEHPEEASMQRVRRPIAKAQSGLADRLFVYGCTAAYVTLVGGVIVALKLYVG
jgi:hypothetical protein